MSMNPYRDQIRAEWRHRVLMMCTRSFLDSLVPDARHETRTLDKIDLVRWLKDRWEPYGLTDVVLKALRECIEGNH